MLSPNKGPVIISYLLEGDLRRTWGGPHFFLVEHGGLERSNESLGGIFSNKSKNLPFAIFWYYL